MNRREETPVRTYLEGERCAFTFERVRPGVLLVVISGYDSGELGTAPLDELTSEVERSAPLELFIDASDARGAAWEVSRQWTHWFRAHQHRLLHVHILVRSRYLHQTVLVAKELSRTANLLTIYSDAERFGCLLRKEHPFFAR